MDKVAQLARLVVYLLLLLVMLLAQVLQDHFTNWNLSQSFYIVSILGLSIQGLGYFFSQKLFLNKKLLAATFVVDLFLISYLLYQTELNQTIFLFLYFFLILLCGVYFELRGSLLMAMGASLTWSFISLLGPEVKAFSFLFLLIVNNIAFFLVAWLSGILSSQLSSLRDKLKASHLSLEVIEELNDSIIKAIPSGLISINQQGEVLLANPAAHKILNINELVGENIEKIFSQNLDKQEKAAFDITYQRDHDEKIIIHCQQVPQKIAMADDQVKLYIFEDLTETRRLEAELRQSEKMSAVGQLATGIAHEIRNPLAGISGSVELLSQQFTSDDDKKLSKIILKEIDRLNNLITEFLEFSKPEKPPVDKVDLEVLFKDLLSTIQHQWKGIGPLQTQMDVQEKEFILGHQDKLKQAFLNIISNSIQAMEGTTNPILKIQLSAKEQSYIVRIKDTGCGIPENLVHKIFEPFMTTKNKGTGLGLAITHKILQSHKAQVSVESTVGLGTEFVISFPRQTKL